MLQRLKRSCRLTTLLLILGFAISLMAVLIGISAMDSILQSLANSDLDAPIILTMQNTGLSLAFSVYLFSIANCLVVTNYWVITKRRNIAIFKAFGWSNFQLICSIIQEMSKILLIGLFIGISLSTIFSFITAGIISITVTPFVLLGTVILLTFTLAVSVILPICYILNIAPAEVIE